MTSDCTQENGFTMFQLNKANPQILTGQTFEKENGYWGGHKKIIQNQSDSLKIEYTNIFGQQIDTTFANAKELSKIKICVNKYKDYETPKFDDRNHYHHFVDACLGGEKTESYFSQSGPMTEAILLGTVAIRVPDTVLEWDAVNMRFPKNREANKYLQRVYRKGWSMTGF